MTESKTCRYCLSDDNVENMVSPCKCKGGIQYVHKNCLIQWINSKISQEHSCEICHTPYKLITKNNISTCMFLLIELMRLTIISIVIGAVLFYDAPKEMKVPHKMMPVHGFVLYIFINGVVSIVIFWKEQNIAEHTEFIGSIVAGLAIVVLEFVCYLTYNEMIIVFLVSMFGLGQTFWNLYYKITQRHDKKIITDILDY